MTPYLILAYLAGLASFPVLVWLAWRLFKRRLGYARQGFAIRMARNTLRNLERQKAAREKLREEMKARAKAACEAVGGKGGTVN